VDKLDNKILSYRSDICKYLIYTLSILAVLALTASLYRVKEIGWQPVMVSQVILVIPLWLIALFQNKVPYKYKAGYLVFLSCTIGLGGLYQYGLIAASIVYIVASSPLATVLFGVRTGIWIFLISYSTAGIIGFLSVSGSLSYKIVIGQYAVSHLAWINSLLNWSVMSIAFMVSIHMLNRNLTNSLKLILVKAIEEKESALGEVEILQGIIPICSYCNNIRNDDNAWEQMEAYIAKHSRVNFSHGVCPDCIGKVRSDSGLD